MMNILGELDMQLVKCIAFLHSSETVPLQSVLEDTLKAKHENYKDLSTLVSICMQQSMEEVKVISPIEETKGSNSDNELELDLLKEDLACVICNAMDVGARNRLLECCDCHSLYHQECHKPAVTLEEAVEGWVCHQCKEANKKMKMLSSSSSSSSSSSTKSSSSKASSTHKHSSSSKSSYKSSSSKSTDKYKSKSPISSGGSSSSKSLSSSTPRSVAPPNINIISADKRLQIMKKKAAKLQEKKKQLLR